MRTYSPFFHSTVWKGPEPTMGVGFWKLFSTVLSGTVLQMCSGRMGIHSPSMFALGLEQVNTTCVASGASTFSMNFM